MCHHLQLWPSFSISQRHPNSTSSPTLARACLLIPSPRNRQPRKQWRKSQLLFFRLPRRPKQEKRSRKGKPRAISWRLYVCQLINDYTLTPCRTRRRMRKRAPMFPRRKQRIRRSQRRDQATFHLSLGPCPT